jgi:seryl-tRNA synthetase
MAQSHHQFSERIERDIEFPLRAFQQNKDFVNIQNISSNLNTVGRTLEEAQHAADKLGKKVGKTNAQKMDMANTKLESATQQWESQAPFVFESLQALDESRVNQLRDLLTQFQTHEADCAAQTQEGSAQALTAVLEVSTETEIQNFANKITAGKARLPTRTSTRRSSTQGTPPGSIAPPSRGNSNMAVPHISEPTVPETEAEEKFQPLPPQEPKPGE